MDWLRQLTPHQIGLYTRKVEMVLDQMCATPNCPGLLPAQIGPGFCSRCKLQHRYDAGERVKADLLTNSGLAKMKAAEDEVDLRLFYGID